MILSMTGEVTLSVISREVCETQLSAGTGSNHACPEVNQVGVPRGCTLGDANAMGIMAGIAWSPHLSLKVPAMLPE